MMGWSENNCSQTGVDLIITGTNITQHGTRYFSVYHTPDFPVIEAVQISMSLPGVFKPVFVKTDVRKGDEDQKDKYAGLYIDGGMLNNYPIHAFDFIEQSDDPKGPQAGNLRELTFRGMKDAYPVAGNPKLRKEDCNCLLGMRLP
jgi:NTE family protein